MLCLLKDIRLPSVFFRNVVGCEWVHYLVFFFRPCSFLFLLCGRLSEKNDIWWLSVWSCTKEENANERERVIDEGEMKKIFENRDNTDKITQERAQSERACVWPDEERGVCVFLREYWKHTKYPSIKAKNPTFFSAFFIQNCYPHLSPVLAGCRMPDVGVPPLERNNQRWTQYDVRAHVGRKSQQVHSVSSDWKTVKFKELLKSRFFGVFYRIWFAFT